MVRIAFDGGRRTGYEKTPIEIVQLADEKVYECIEVRKESKKLEKRRKGSGGKLDVVDLLG